MLRRPSRFRPERREGYGFPWETTLQMPGTVSASSSAVRDIYQVPAAALCEISPEGKTIEVTQAMFTLGGTGREGNGTSPVTGTTIKIAKNGTTAIVATGTIASIAGGVTLGHAEVDMRDANGEGVYLAPGDYLNLLVTAIPTNGGAGSGVVAPTNLSAKLRGYTQGAK